ncbi:hypothetical protein VNO77_22785 [Canavalia gladiata]|uniref:Uncharacterized protein n=1 Tax=Canavalia gladiata TaxID=3824 RepID=A0AAN9QBA8_CANGL
MSLGRMTPQMINDDLVNSRLKTVAHLMPSCQVASCSISFTSYVYHLHVNVKMGMQNGQFVGYDAGLHSSITAKVLKTDSLAFGTWPAFSLDVLELKSGPFTRNWVWSAS